MASFAIHPPVHLRADPDNPIRSVEEAAQFVRSRADRGRALAVLERLNHANNTEQAEAAGQAFREWLIAEGLLLIPPEET